MWNLQVAVHVDDTKVDVFKTITARLGFPGSSSRSFTVYVCCDGELVTADVRIDPRLLRVVVPVCGDAIPLPPQRARAVSSDDTVEKNAEGDEKENANNDKRGDDGEVDA